MFAVHVRLDLKYESTEGRIRRVYNPTCAVSRSRLRCMRCKQFQENIDAPIVFGASKCHWRDFTAQEFFLVKISDGHFQKFHLFLQGLKEFVPDSLFDFWI